MNLSYQAQKHLRGITSETPADTNETLVRKTRLERERVPEEMAANLMDWYMNNLNDDTQINPVRDGIPQCKAHPFNPPKSYGCIHSCSKTNPNIALPVAREANLGEVWEWVRALVNYSVGDAEIRRGFRRQKERDF